MAHHNYVSLLTYKQENSSLLPHCQLSQPPLSCARQAARVQFTPATAHLQQHFHLHTHLETHPPEATEDTGRDLTQAGALYPMGVLWAYSRQRGGESCALRGLLVWAPPSLQDFIRAQALCRGSGPVI